MAAIFSPIELVNLNPKFPFFSFARQPKCFPKTLHFDFNPRRRWVPVKSSISDQEIDMVRTKGGVYAPKEKKVVILWDLDNKPPRGPPFDAAIALKSVAQKFGSVIDISAYANRHAFIHMPQWVVEERRERRQIDLLEKKGLSSPSQPYICSVCGRKCKTHMDLKKHFQQLHERERQKKLSRMRSLKGKKRQRFKERFIDGNEKYNEAARSLLTPKVGYGLAQELKRAGVFVKTVQDKPQAADWALKKQMLHSMSSGVDWIVLVSDDSDFSEMLNKARDANMGTVVVGDQDRSLGRYADVWLPWIKVENREVKDADLELRARDSVDDVHESKRGFTVSFFDGEDEYRGSDMRFGGSLSFSGDYGEDDDWITTRLTEDEDDEDGDYILESEDEMWL